MIKIWLGVFLIVLTVPQAAQAQYWGKESDYTREGCEKAFKAKRREAEDRLDKAKDEASSKFVKKFPELAAALLKKIPMGLSVTQSGESAWAAVAAESGRALAEIREKRRLVSPQYKTARRMTSEDRRLYREYGTQERSLREKHEINEKALKSMMASRDAIATDLASKVAADAKLAGVSLKHDRAFAFDPKHREFRFCGKALLGNYIYDTDELRLCVRIPLTTLEATYGMHDFFFSAKTTPNSDPEAQVLDFLKTTPKDFFSKKPNQKYFKRYFEDELMTDMPWYCEKGLGENGLGSKAKVDADGFGAKHVDGATGEDERTTVPVRPERFKLGKSTI